MAESIQLGDWSARHVRLRWELVVIALAVYLIARYDAQLSSNFLVPLDLSAIPTGFVFWVLIVLEAYLVAHFVIRTIAEWAEISKAFERAGELIETMPRVAEELKEALGTMVFNDPKNRIDSIHEAAARTSAPKAPPFSEPELEEKLAEWLDRFPAEMEKIEIAINARIPPQARLDEFKNDIASFRDLTRGFAQQLQVIREDWKTAESVHRESQSSLKQEIAAARKIVEENAPAQLEALKASIEGSLKEIDLIESRRRRDLRSAWLERVTFSAVLPVLFAVVLSLTAIGYKTSIISLAEAGNLVWPSCSSSVQATCIAEGLAAEWTGRRHDWCGG